MDGLGSKHKRANAKRRGADRLHTMPPFALVGKPPHNDAPVAEVDAKLALTQRESPFRPWLELHGHAGRVNALCFSADGESLVSASADRSIQRWSAQSGEPIGGPLRGHYSVVESVIFAPNGQRLISCGQEGQLIFWDLETRHPQHQHMIGLAEFLTAVALSPDGQTLALASRDGPIRLLDTDEGRVKGVPLMTRSNGVCFTRNGEHLLSVDLDAGVDVWHVASARRVTRLSAHEKHAWCVAVSPDGRFIATGGGDNKVVLYDAERFEPLAEPCVGHDGSVTALAFSPDSHELVSGGKDGRLYIWDAASGRPLCQPLSIGDAWIRALAFSPDGQVLASNGPGPGSVRLWSAATGDAVVGRRKLPWYHALRRFLFG